MHSPSTPFHSLSQDSYKSPTLWIAPLALLVVLLVVSELVIWSAANSYKHSLEQQATGMLLSKRSGLESALLAMKGPITALSAMVHMQPNISELNKQYDKIITDVVSVLDPQSYIFAIKVRLHGAWAHAWKWGRGVARKETGRGGCAS
jgi:hypothetical protein